MIGLWLALSAFGADVCPSGCTFATVQEAVDSVGPGGFGNFGIEPGYYDGAVTIDGGRAIWLRSAGFDPVVLTAVPDASSVMTVDGSSTLNLTGISIDADQVRGIDALGGSTVNMSLGVFYGTGPLRDGALIRVRDGRLTAAAMTFIGGYSVTFGGQILATDSDVDLVGVTMEDGSATSGGAIWMAASGTRHTLTMTGVRMNSSYASGTGGAVGISGEVDASFQDCIFTNGDAAQGAGLSVEGAGASVQVAAGAFTDNFAIARGAHIWVGGGQLEVIGVPFSGGIAAQGGAMAVEGGGSLSTVDTVVTANVAAADGAGVWADNGFLAITGGLLFDNVAGGDGGGIWLGPGATSRIVRADLCQNSALTGGGIWLGAGADTEVSNARLVGNQAATDGGGIFHAGPGNLTVRFSNMLGSTSGSGGGSAISTRGRLIMADSLVGWSSGGRAIRRTSQEPVAYEGGTDWWANEAGDADDLAPTTPGALFADPQLNSYNPSEGCALVRDQPNWYGPLRDAGSVDRLDPDGSRADVGAYGGPLADPLLWETDDDDDGSPALYDCDELDPLTNPLADDPPYDGLDSNCDGSDDYDGDEDGHRPPEYGGDDCDDMRADVYPEAPELAQDPPVDMNCDGRFDADGDGFEPPDDCDDDDPDAWPGAVDDDPTRDLDCDGFTDVPSPIRPVGCDSSSGGPWTGWLLAALALFRRRRIDIEPHNR